MKQLNRQTIRNYEIIFCDNNSENNSLKILKKYKVKKIIKFKRYIPGDILNKAINKSSGKYICILSAHCIPVGTKWLEEHINEINSNSKIAASFGKQIPMPGTTVQNLIDLDIIFKDQQILYKKDPYLNNANAFYKAEILKKNLFDSKLTNIEDRVWAKYYKVLYFLLCKSLGFPFWVYQHESKSLKAQNTYKILVNKYQKTWKNCLFMKPDYYNFGIILNGRRINNTNKMKTKLSYIYKEIKKKKFFKKIILINPLNYKIFTNKIQNIKSNKTLKEDLKQIYNKYSKNLIDINYIVYLNLDEKINFNKILRLISHTVYYNLESATFGEKIKENFIINLREVEQFRSTSLESADNKPSITLLKWAKGSVFDTEYLRKGVLFTEKTQIKFL